MLAITDAAGAHLLRMLADKNAADNIAVRLVDDGDGIVLEADSAREGDTRYDHGGRIVLLMDAGVTQLLGSSTLDVVGAELSLTPSNS